MVLLNNYFHHDKLANTGKISVSGKLEAFIGNYFVSGEGCPGETILLIYYDSKIDSYYNAVENIEFDYETFERIDDGIEYLNPDHFSINEMISIVRNGEIVD